MRITNLLIALALVGPFYNAIGGEIINYKPKYHQREAAEYWDQERLDKAKPMRAPKLTNKERELQLMPIAPSFDRETGAMSERGVQEDGGNPRRANVTVRPFSSGGKLFLTSQSGDGSCTAQYVGNSKHVLMTAAHCVYDRTRGKWNDKFWFYRGFANGGGQQTSVECISIWTDFYDPRHNRAYDYAFLYTTVKSNGGSMGLKTPIPDADLTAIGYAGKYENARYMYRVDGSRGNISGGLVVMNDNPLEHGASGGAWISDLDKGNYAVGLNSGGTDTYEVSPYFDDKTWQLYRHVKAKNCM